ncbi:MAG: hypothetical protein KGO96_10375 [Elusimicrobia bacterium]|nr:hypothetical protein [Elusimicrobiota bacterium]
MRTNIVGYNGRRLAVICDVDDGISVEMWSRGRSDAPWRLISRDVVDCPFHLVCDHVSALIGGE